MNCPPDFPERADMARFDLQPLTLRNNIRLWEMFSAHYTISISISLSISLKTEVVIRPSNLTLTWFGKRVHLPTFESADTSFFCGLSNLRLRAFCNERRGCCAWWGPLSMEMNLEIVCSVKAKLKKPCTKFAWLQQVE